MTYEELNRKYRDIISSHIEKEDEYSLYEMQKLARACLTENFGPEILVRMHSLAIEELIKETKVGVGRMMARANVALLEVMTTYGLIYQEFLEGKKAQYNKLTTYTQKIEEQAEHVRDLYQELEISNSGTVALYKKLDEKNQQLTEMNARLEKASGLKTEFLAGMSHELRTPLNSIIGFTSIILQGMVGKVNDEQKKQLNIVYNSAKHLLGLINELLDLSKIEAGKMDIAPARFSVKELINMVQKMVLSLIIEKGLSLRVTLSDDLPPTIYNDKVRIKQVLINLISNALKFTQAGRICLTVRSSRLDPRSLREEFKKEDQSGFQPPASSLVFSVSDTGLGLKPEHLEEIFDQFKQIEGSLKEKPVGTGLGLAISKKMVQMMGGRIWVESEYGKGSCFQFSVSIKEIAKGPSLIVPEALDPVKKLVLTIDDDRQDQEILKIYLESEGYQVIQAYHAEEALDTAGKYRPMAITLDMLMPDKDGWDILHELKKDPKTKDIPVIFISILDNREMGLSLGAVEYLVKPISKEQMMAVIKRVEMHSRIYNVMIVDDNPQDVEFLTQYISPEDKYMVTKAYGGKEALLRVEQSRPDLIILDLIMPEFNGFEVISRLKKSEKTRHIPIIIVTAKELTQEEIKYLHNNISKIIKKGAFRKQDLLRDIKRTLDKIV